MFGVNSNFGFTLSIFCTSIETFFSFPTLSYATKVYVPICSVVNSPVAFFELVPSGNSTSLNPLCVSEHSQLIIVVESVHSLGLCDNAIIGSVISILFISIECI